VAYAQDILMCKRLIFAVTFAARIDNSYLSEQKMVAIHSWGRYARVNIEVSTAAQNVQSIPPENSIA